MSDTATAQHPIWFVQEALELSAKCAELGYLESVVQKEMNEVLKASPKFQPLMILVDGKQPSFWKQGCTFQTFTCPYSALLSPDCPTMHTGLASPMVSYPTSNAEATLLTMRAQNAIPVHGFYSTPGLTCLSPSAFASTQCTSASFQLDLEQSDEKIDSDLIAIVNATSRKQPGVWNNRKLLFFRELLRVNSQNPSLESVFKDVKLLKVLIPNLPTNFCDPIPDFENPLLACWKLMQFHFAGNANAQAWFSKTNLESKFEEQRNLILTNRKIGLYNPECWIIAMTCILRDECASRPFPRTDLTFLEEQIAALQTEIACESCSAPNPSIWRRGTVPQNGQYLETRDEDVGAKVFRVAQVIEGSIMDHVKIHFVGWSPKYDRNVPIHSLAELGTESKGKKTYHNNKTRLGVVVTSLIEFLVGYTKWTTTKEILICGKFGLEVIHHLIPVDDIVFIPMVDSATWPHQEILERNPDTCSQFMRQDEFMNCVVTKK